MTPMARFLQVFHAPVSWLPLIYDLVVRRITIV